MQFRSFHSQLPIQVMPPFPVIQFRSFRDSQLCNSGHPAITSYAIQVILPFPVIQFRSFRDSQLCNSGHPAITSYAIQVILPFPVIQFRSFRHSQLCLLKKGSFAILWLCIFISFQLSHSIISCHHQFFHSLRFVIPSCVIVATVTQMFSDESWPS